MRRAAPKGVAGAAAAAQSTFANLTPDLNAFKRGVESARDCRRKYAELAKDDFFFAVFGKTAA